MVWVTDEEDALDCAEGCAGQALKSIDGGCGTLRVTFEDEALVRVGGDTGADMVDDL